MHHFLLVLHFVAAVVLSCNTTFAQTWRGPGCTLTLSPEGGRLTLQNQSLPATVTTADDGTVTGHVILGQDRHSYTFTPADASGQRTLHLGGKAYALQPAAAPSSQPQAPLKLKTHTFKDPGVRNMESHTVLVPDGWSAKGGPWWAGENYFNVLPSQLITVSSPDGVEVEIAPSYAFKEFRQNPAAGLNMPAQKEGQSDAGYPVLFMPEGPQAWAQWIETRGIPQTYPDATNIKLIDISVVQEMMPAMRAIIAPLQQNIAQQNQLYGRTGEDFVDGVYYAAHIRFDRNGKTWEQLTGFGVYWMGSQYEFGRQLWWGIEGARTFTAPAGELYKNMPVLMAIADSVRTTPQWHQNCTQLAAQLAGISAQGAADRARQTSDAQTKIRQTYNETSDIVANTYDPNAGVSSQKNYINAINEVEDYSTPGGDQVQLPSGYTNVYTNNRNEYLLTNDVLHHPNTQSLDMGNWQQMNTAR